MSGTRGLSRKRRHILTTVFVVVAVIAAMINVPWMKANAREAARSFEPNLTLGNNDTKNGKSGTDPNYGFLVWAGGECLMVCVWEPNPHKEMNQNDYYGETRSGR